MRPGAPVTGSAPKGLPTRLEIPVPAEPLEGHITLLVSGGGRGRLLVQGRWVANIGRGHTTVPVREGDLIEVDARASGVLLVTSVQVTEPLALLPDCLPIEAGRRLVTLGWIRGPSWPGADPSGR